ncbi:hypothetical protein Bhyg_12463, partial [Pseudolycoriella hygida]
MKNLRFMAKQPNGWTLPQVEERLRDQLQGQQDNRKLIVHVIYEGKVVDCWRKNLATESFYFSLKWAFDEMQLHRVQWRTTEFNFGMRRWLENVCQLNVE